MTIYIVAKKIPWASVNATLDQYDSIIDKGFNGYYSLSDEDKNKEYVLALSLEVDSMIPEIREMRKILRIYITDFECMGNVVTSVQPTADETVTDNTEEKPEAVTDESPKLTPEDVVRLFFSNIHNSGREDKIRMAIHQIFADGNITNKKTYNNYIALTTMYVKAETKPKSFTALCKAANKSIAPTTVKKVNLLIQKKFGLNTFMDFLKTMPNLADEDTDVAEPEEVILEKPKKPPKKPKISINKEDVINDKMKNLDYTIRHIPKNIPLSEKAQLLLKKMGLQSFEKDNRNFVKKIFGSILFFRESNIEKLFERDMSLKRFGTLTQAESVLKNFLEKFFKISITHEDVEKFSEDLIIKFFGATEKPQKNNSTSAISTDKKQNTKQSCGFFKCFPKHDKFDNFLKGICLSRGTRKNKVAKILDYMGLQKLPNNEIEIIEKLCLKHLYMLEFYNPEQYYTVEEKEILERFVNDFAKTLSENANFISLKAFIKELSTIPVS